MMKIQDWEPMAGGQANARVPTSQGHIDMICNELAEVEKLAVDLTKPLEDLVGLDTLGVDTISRLGSLAVRIMTLRHRIHYIHSLASRL